MFIEQDIPLCSHLNDSLQSHLQISTQCRIYNE